MTRFETIYNTYFHDVFLYIRRLSGDEHIQHGSLRVNQTIQ